MLVHGPAHGIVAITVDQRLSPEGAGATLTIPATATRRVDHCTFQEPPPAWGLEEVIVAGVCGRRGSSCPPAASPGCGRRSATSRASPAASSTSSTCSTVGGALTPDAQVRLRWDTIGPRTVVPVGAATGTTMIVDLVRDGPHGLVGGTSGSGKTEFLKTLFCGTRPPVYQSIKPSDMQESYWVQLKNPEKFQGIKSAVQGLPGVNTVRDLREVLKPIYFWMNVFQWGAISIAAFLVVAAILQVGNTIRLAAFARRREIGIMRLVGASSLYIQLPFLMESLVAALVGVGLAAGALVLFMWVVIYGTLRPSSNIVAWVDWGTPPGRSRRSP